MTEALEERGRDEQVNKGHYLDGNNVGKEGAYLQGDIEGTCST